MKKLLGLIIFLAIVGLGGYYVYANYIVSEKERVAEAFNNTMNLKEYTTQTLLGLELSGVELTEEQQTFLKSVEVGVRSVASKDVIESYLVMKANLNFDGYVKEYPINLTVGANINLKEEVINIDFSQLLKLWNDFSTKGYEKLDDAVFESMGMTKDEFKLGADAIALKMKETMGKDIFEKDKGYALSMSFQEVSDEMGLSKEEMDEFINAMKQEGMTEEDKMLLDLVKRQANNVIQLISEEMFKEKSFVLTHDNVLDIATTLLKNEEVKKEVMKIAEKEESPITEKEYAKMVDSLKEGVNEAMKSMKMKQLDVGFNYDINKKEKIFNSYNVNIHGELETGEKGTLSIKTVMAPQATFAFPKNAKKVSMEELEKAITALSEEFDLGNEAYGEEEYGTYDNIEEAFGEESTGVMDENMNFEIETLPLEFIQDEEKENHTWQKREEVVAADGNTYVNYHFNFTDPSNGHFQDITKQTLKNPTDNSERVLVYYKHTGYAGGDVYKQEYQLLWDEGGEYHQYKEIEENQVTGEVYENVTKGRYYEDDYFEAME